MRGYKVDDNVLVRTGRGTLVEAKIVEVIPKLFGKRYVVMENMISLCGIKHGYKEVRKKQIACLKESNK